MKRIVAVLSVVLCMVPAFACADIDLSGMSYDELVELSKDVGLAIMSHEDFDSVVVPMGLWEVGVDIPEGTWIITSEKDYTSVIYGSKLDESGNDMNGFSKGNTFADIDKGETWRVAVENGNYICVKYNQVTFTSDTGSSSLGFKKK